ncbi:MAG: rhamnulokinase [Prevotellaceae bacterium]|jgi:rhamnulokinase|nr:rhamnulokinase [Prevotellaceae bacterium]
MNKLYNFFALDLGATSGRSILATLQDNKISLKELTRFPNKIIRVGDKFYWNIYSLFDELKNGLRVAGNEKIKIASVGIDTWGVDFVYVADDGTFLGLPRAYRDPYTNGAPEEYFKKIPRKEVYELTGIQIMNFNSLYQLYAAGKESSSAQKTAKNILFMPDALSYMLTGNKVCEYTIASTSQILNPRTKEFEIKLFEPLEIPASVMLPLAMPGKIIGNILDSIQTECGIEQTPVIAVAGHDTASAIAAVPARNENFAYLSSGTWSLMGIEVKEPIISEQSFRMNFTNEGGIEGTTRFLKNITGMWLLEQCRKEWELQGKSYTYEEIVRLSDSVEGFRSIIDPDYPGFANPESMTKAIAAYCADSNQQKPENHAEYIRCIFDSLALKYKYVLDCLQQVAPFKIEKLHVIGGGSQNKLLNQFIANSIGLPVVAGPSEATAIGNVMVQAKGLGIVNSLSEMRAIIGNSVSLETFYPENSAQWDEAYNRFHHRYQQINQ